MALGVRTEGNGAAVTAAPLDPTRVLTRRRRLPSSRAVVGGFLVALAALAAFVAAQGTGDGPSHRYVVAARDLIAGSTLRADDLRTEAVDLPSAMAGRAFTDPSTLIGRVTTTALASGELVQASSVVSGEAADPRFQLSIPVERSRALDGLLVAGESVDLLVTYGTGDNATTFVVVRGADVLRVDHGQRGTLTADNDTVILIAVSTPDDALAVTHAAQAGEITVVRATAAPTGTGPDSYRPPSTNG